MIEKNLGGPMLSIRLVISYLFGKIVPFKSSKISLMLCSADV